MHISAIMNAAYQISLDSSSSKGPGLINTQTASVSGAASIWFGATSFCKKIGSGTAGRAGQSSFSVRENNKYEGKRGYCQIKTKNIT